jgi:hypothetical protein
MANLLKLLAFAVLTLAMDTSRRSAGKSKLNLHNFRMTMIYNLEVGEVVVKNPVKCGPPPAPAAAQPTDSKSGGYSLNGEVTSDVFDVCYGYDDPNSAIVK